MSFKMFEPTFGLKNSIYVQSGPQKTVPYIILFKMLLHLFIRTKWHTI